MRALRALAPGKVNATLYVGRPREDGYHPLASVVQPLTLADELTLEASTTGRDELVCEGVEGENLAVRALDAYREATAWAPGPLRLTIVKRVPVAAGMGGGSADAAAALRLAAFAHGRDVPEELAVRLGADVPALLHGGRVLMTGIGERVEALRDAPHAVYLVVPGEGGLSTPAVYAEYDRLGLGREPGELEELAGAIRTAGGGPAVNDLQAAAISLQPGIAKTLDALREAGAHDAIVSGSGPTAIGVFAGEESAREAAGRIAGAIVAAPAAAEHGAVR